MKVGLNWTSPTGYLVVKRLVDEGRVQMCEILVDNFLHLDPVLIRDSIGDIDVGFHIMRSRFLERSYEELVEFSDRVKLWVREVKPVYVSDHIAQFTFNGRSLPMTVEVDYSNYEYARDRVALWQDLLGDVLLIENFASLSEGGVVQPEFYSRLISDVGVKLLFDVSNSVAAAKNCKISPSVWLPLVKDVSRFHIAGFRCTENEPQLLIDSHDCTIDDVSAMFLKEVLPTACEPKSIIVERDFNITYESWRDDIATVSEIVGSSDELRNAS